MRLILLGFLLRRKDKLPEDGMSVYSQMIKKQVSAIQPIERYVMLARKWLTSLRSRDPQVVTVLPPGVLW